MRNKILQATLATSLAFFPGKVGNPQDIGQTIVSRDGTSIPKNVPTQVIGVKEEVHANILQTLEQNPQKITTNITESQRTYLQNELILAWEKIQPTEIGISPEGCQKQNEFVESTAEFLEKIDIKDARIYHIILFQLRNSPEQLLRVNNRKNIEEMPEPIMIDTNGSCKSILDSIRYSVFQLEGLLRMLDKYPYLQNEFTGTEFLITREVNGIEKKYTIKMPLWNDFLKGNFNIHTVGNIHLHIISQHPEISNEYLLNSSWSS